MTISTVRPLWGGVLPLGEPQSGSLEVTGSTRGRFSHEKGCERCPQPFVT